MLVLSRHLNEAIIIAHNVKVTILQVRGNTIKLGIEAPREVSVHREEIEVEIEQVGPRGSLPLRDIQPPLSYRRG